MTPGEPTSPSSVERAHAHAAWPVAGLLFGSGFCALVYQTVWLREFRLVFGASTAASAAVLAIFMAGLGFGGLALGPRVDRLARPLRFYAALELGIAALAALTPALIALGRYVYLQAGGSLALGPALGTALRLVLATLVLILPTLAMGGTLPAAGRATVRTSDTQRRSLALLYAANTLGAVAGALVATFLLLERLGNHGTLWLACSLNALVALIAFGLRPRPAPPAPASAAPDPSPPSAPVLTTSTPPDLAAPALPPMTLVLSAAAISGFAFLLMELVWYRMLSPLLGGSVFTFGLILAVALLGIGVGSFLYTATRPHRFVSLPGLALTFALEALALVIPFALGDQIAFLALALRRFAEAGFLAQSLGWSLVAAIVVLPAAAVAGFQFPLLLALLGRGRERLGRQVGLAYAWNTFGAIAGSLAGGFGLLPLLSAPGTWRFTVALLVGLGFILVAVAARRPSTKPADYRPLRLPTGFALLASLLLLSPGPSAVWRHSGIGAGRSDAYARISGAARRDQANVWRRTVVWEQDGVESSVALIAEKGLAFFINGKNDGNARSDAGTSVLSGLLGALLHPHPTRALVIGLGTGSTAGWLAAVPSLRQVDVIELEPAIREVATACAPVNHDAPANPRIQVHIGDARELTALLPPGYDLIFSEPSNPYRAGVASLFTREFYTTVARTLTEDGLLLQWVQAYEVDVATLKIACATLASVFPTVEAWSTQVGDLLFVASRQPLNYDVARLRQRLTEEPFRTAIPRIWRVTDLEGLLAHYVSSDRLSRQLALAPQQPLNTDHRTLMEFRFARSMGPRAPIDVRDWFQLALAHDAARPPIDDPSIDGSAVLDRRATLFALESVPPAVDPAATPHQLARTEAKAHYARGDLAHALAAWRHQPDPPQDLLEIVLLAEGLADLGDNAAEPWIERLRPFQPIEADVLRARLEWRQQRASQAVAHLESAFTSYRSDPWPWPILMYRALDLAQNLSHTARDPALAARLHDALSQPFAVRCWEQARLACRFNIALDTADPLRLRDAIAAFEPHVPWRQSFLERRAACYELLGDPRLAQARYDLQRFQP